MRLAVLLLDLVLKLTCIELTLLIVLFVLQKRLGRIIQRWDLITFVKNNANAYISILLWGHNLRGRSTLPDTMIHNVRK